MGNKSEKKAQEVFLQQQKGQAPKIIIGEATSSSPIPSEGIILVPVKRTKEEEERLAKTPSATIGAPEQIRQTGRSSTPLSGRRERRVKQ